MDRNPVVSESKMLEKGRESYRHQDREAERILIGIDYLPAHRNKGIDGILAGKINALPAFIRVQRKNESIGYAISALKNASKNKGSCSLILVLTNHDLLDTEIDSEVITITSTSLALTNLIKNQSAENNKKSVPLQILKGHNNT